MLVLVCLRERCWDRIDPSFFSCEVPMETEFRVFWNDAALLASAFGLAPCRGPGFRVFAALPDAPFAIASLLRR